MTTTLIRGRYAARTARSGADIAAAQALRYRAFIGKDDGGVDRDRFDDLCTHFLIEDARAGDLVGCFRILPLTSGAQISQSYSAQSYDLSALAAFSGPMIELGRFCMHPGVHDPDILRIAWGALTRHVDAHGVKMLFGCSSFKGIDPVPHADGFALLTARHLAPQRWRPDIKAPEVVRFAHETRYLPGNAALGQGALPPLLRTYLLMGGWVSDHAVVDRQMNTLHVFTGLEIDAIPEQRKRVLRMTADMLDGVRPPR